MPHFQQEQQPDAAMAAETRTKLVVIDSRDRDIDVYPMPNEYEIRLDDELMDVVSVELMLADMPFSAYMVDERNWAVPFSLDGGATVLEAKLDKGDYPDPADLAATLQSAMRAASGGQAQFIVSYVARTDNFEIRLYDTQLPFRLMFCNAARTAAAILGFKPNVDHESHASAHRMMAGPAPQVLTSAFRRAASPNRYIVMSVSPSAELLSSTNNATNRSFAIVPRDASNLNVNSSSLSYEKTWNPPLSRFSRIALEFTDYHGDPYDFQNQEHHVQLLFTCKRHHRKYTVI